MGVIKSENVPLKVAAFSMTDIEGAARRILLRARSQAEQMLAAAQTEGEKLRQEAKTHGLEEGRVQGMVIGMEEGKETGHAAALAEHGAQMTQLVNSLSDALAIFNQQRDDLNTVGITEVVRLACSIAQRVTRRQGIEDPKVLEENLKEAMGLVIHATDVRISVHPSQFRTLQHEMPRLRLSWPKFSHVEIIQDTELTPGSARVSTAGGLVDGELETKLDCVIGEVMSQHRADERPKLVSAP